LIYPTLLILIFFGYKDKEKTKRKSKNYALWNQVPEESAERSSMRPGKWEGWINLAMLEEGPSLARKSSQLFPSWRV
jgi:hypothetical protein